MSRAYELDGPADRLPSRYPAQDTTREDASGWYATDSDAADADLAALWASRDAAVAL